MKLRAILWKGGKKIEMKIDEAGDEIYLIKIDDDKDGRFLLTAIIPELSKPTHTHTDGTHCLEKTTVIIEKLEWVLEDG